MSAAWRLPRPVPPPAADRVAYTALCPYGRQAEWLSERVPGDGDGVRVVCLCRCTRCLLAVASGVAVAPC